MIKSSSTSDKELIDEITAPKVYEWIKFLFFVVISFHSLLAGILTFLTYEGSPIGKVISYSKDKWGEGLHFLLDNLTKLSAVVVFVLLIFLWYFVSKYGVTRRAIAQANKKKLEDVIQLFRKLDEPISKVILKGSENIQYAFNCYDLIQEFWVFNKYPNVFIKSHRNYLITEWEREGSNYFLFNDIAEIDDVIKGLEILNSPENKKFTYWFSRYRFELVRFINMTSIRVDKLGTYDRLLFTKKGFSSITEKKPSRFVVKDENVKHMNVEKLKDEKDFFIRYVLNRNIIEGIELLYAFYRYIETLNKVMHIESDKLGRGIRLFTGKE